LQSRVHMQARCWFLWHHLMSGTPLPASVPAARATTAVL
jgi:hypothetical protein